ncbi:MAG: FAD-dependent monooxygenase [Verrucomicrobiota bacterium]
MNHPIQIVGGGLAGLLLGIRLLREGVPVTLVEAGQYPRHRICGEFLSGNGVRILEENGLLEPLLERGARRASQVAFYSSTKLLQQFEIPDPAICISRFQFDQALVDSFQRAGGELITGMRFRPQEGQGDTGVVWAIGRNQKNRDPQGWRWFGLKMHAQAVELEADLEMHLHENAYIGLCRVEGGSVNLCGLFRNRPGEPDAFRRPMEEVLSGPIGSILNERTSNAKFLPETRCAVGGLDLLPKKAVDHSTCRVGDSVTMIPPLTGNGMSMALESADASTAPLASYSRGGISWEQARALAASSMDQRFESRLYWARLLQRFLFLPVGREVALEVSRRLPFLWTSGFLRTR